MIDVCQTYAKMTATLAVTQQAVRCAIVSGLCAPAAHAYAGAVQCIIDGVVLAPEEEFIWTTALSVGERVMMERLLPLCVCLCLSWLVARCGSAGGQLEQSLRVI